VPRVPGSSIPGTLGGAAPPAVQVVVRPVGSIVKRSDTDPDLLQEAHIRRVYK
jgi:hypothetical protein